MNEEPESKLYRLAEEAMVVRGTWRITWKNVGTGEVIVRRFSQAQYEESSKKPDEKPFWTLEEIGSVGEPWS